MEQPRLAELQRQYEQATTEQQKIDLLTDITLEVRSDDPEKAILMAEEIIERSQEIGYQLGIGNGLNHLGACYWLMGEYEDGLDELTEAYIIAKEIKDRSLEAKILNNFGRIYRGLGDIDSALRDFESALEINEELGNEINQTINLTNISNLYYDLADYDTALDYALKCQPIFERYKDNARLISIYLTLGEIYFKKNFFDEALLYFRKVQDLSDPDTQSHSLADSGVGKVYYRLNDFEKASDYLNRALAQAKHFENPEAEIVAEFYLGRLLIYKGELSEALVYMEHAYDLAKDSLRRHDLMNIHEHLSDLYDRMGNVQQAYHHLKAFEKLKEEIFQQATLNKLRNLQIKNQIEVAKKEKEVAERTARLKQQFMANMSHEIRTPMNAIVGITRLLLEKEPKPEQVKYLNVIKQASDSLLVIINDILDIAKIEAGKIVIEEIDFSFRELIDSLQEIMSLKALEKKLAFKIDIDSQIPGRIAGDPTRLNQILINLVGNAVKFTDTGYIQLSCKTIKLTSDEVTIQFDVADTGIGIQKDYVSKIFESFTQAGTDTARKFGGTGLGLTISKELVDLMGGTISVFSEEGKGTTFSVIITFKIASEQTTIREENSISEDSKELLGNIALLLVEDNEFNRLVAEDTLKELLPRIQIDIAENGAIAIEKIKQQHYDLVLMDIQMPVMDGVTATKIIRTELTAPKSNIGIIAMTANVLQEDVQRYFDAGMNAYISKPFQTEDLLLKMAKVVEENAVLPPTDDVAKSIPNGVGNFSNIPEVVTDMNFLNQFTGGNADKRKKYIGMFLDNAPKLLSRILTAFAQNDYEELRVAAHSMKPQMSYMGIKEEVSNIFLIEQSAGQQAHRDNIGQLIAQLEKVCEKAFAELQSNM